MAFNKVILMGRLTNNIELKQTPNGVSVCSFSLAVDRNYVKQGEERQADFIDCVAWRQTAEFISKYFSKGKLILIEGELQTRNYEDKNGNKRKAVEVYVTQSSFTGEPKQHTDNVPAGTPPMPTEELDGFEVQSNDGVPF